MSIFEITEEHGPAAILIAREKQLPPTPWLLSTSDGLKLNMISFATVILSAGDNIDIPENSFITPKLAPIAKNLETSIRYELNLFLDRLDLQALPRCFGLVFNPFEHPEDYLDQLLSYHPSIIGLQIKDIDHISSEELLHTIIEIRNRVPRNIALYLPGGVGLGSIALMIALGIDILDDSVVYSKAAQGIIYQDGFENRSNLPLKQAIQVNSRSVISDYVASVQALKENTLWRRIARDMHVSPSKASMISILNREILPNTNLFRYPQRMENKLLFTGDEGLYHPDVLAFQQRTIERYRVLEEKELLLLLPCSAKKPYRNSKSHTNFERAVGDAVKFKRELIETWSLTSPLGVVPRSIETVYPAAYYDIPVTGYWSNEEVQRVGEMLITMLDQLPRSIPIVAHVSKDYAPLIEFVSRHHEIIVSWDKEKPSSKIALDQLGEFLKQYLDPIEFSSLREKNHMKIARRDIPGLLQFFHGRELTINFDNIRLVGRPPRPIQIQKNKSHYLSWDQLKGEIRLSPEAALDYANVSENWILVDAEGLKGSSLYGAGILEASTKISPGDEVLIFNNTKSKLLGVGNALISGVAMNQVEYGRIASLRKKFRMEVKA
ncbi:MAG: DUF5591 domain-containing protein [Candidatus Heimdallarchaeota archaeon]|nr:DUF5591 domain-containing protein [Candidatus Heimdallarchaeota archaeon]